MSTHNIGFYEDLTNIIFELSSNIIKYAPYFFCWERTLNVLVASIHVVLPYSQSPYTCTIIHHLLERIYIFIYSFDKHENFLTPNMASLSLSVDLLSLAKAPILVPCSLPRWGQCRA